MPGVCDGLPSRVLKTPVTGIETQTSWGSGGMRGRAVAAEP